MAKEERGVRERIVAHPDVLAGKPVVRGTRIAVEHVLEQLADNPDVDELFEVYPDLSLEDVQACLTYAHALAAGESVDPAPGPHPGKQAVARTTA